METSDSAFQLAAKIALELVYLGDDGDEQALLEDLADLRACEDAMGRDTIVYFPRVAWPEECGDDDDEDDDDHDCEGPECCTPESTAAAE